MNPPSEPDASGLEEGLAAAVERAASLEEIEAWLRSRRHVRSVELAGYLLKSHPPQRDFVVEVETDRGTVTRVVRVQGLGGDFRLRSVHDA